MCNLPDKDFNWNSGCESAVRVDDKNKVWTCEVRIPIKSFGGSGASVGARWRINLFRGDKANHASMAWNPALVSSFHTPERFGTLFFVE
jgi:hypothetical protein